MDDERALLKARLDALETVVLSLVRVEPALSQIRDLLQREHEQASRIANEPQVARFPSRIELNPRPYRDMQATQAKAEAYRRLVEKLG